MSNLDAYESAAPFIPGVINRCFLEGVFVIYIKLSLLRPRLMKLDLDVKCMKNYCPVKDHDKQRWWCNITEVGIRRDCLNY